MSIDQISNKESGASSMAIAIQNSLKFIRPLLGLTVQGMAELIGLTRQTINNLESKRTTITTIQCIAICAVIDNRCKENNEELRKIKQIIIDNSDVKLNINSNSNKSFLQEWFNQTDSDQICDITLLGTTQSISSNIIGIPTSKGQVHAASGLNWGYSSGCSSLGDAYIPINKENIIKAKQMFIKPSNVNIPIKSVWDDGEEIMLLLEGVRFNSGDNNIYPKQISSYKNKSAFGNYLRKRIGNQIGRNLIHSSYAISTIADIKSRNSRDKESIKEEIRNNHVLFQELNDKFITLDDLQQYGRTNISVSILEDGTYYFDFSI
jgi:DNA-binding XRE family transcriptional regulator